MAELRPTLPCTPCPSSYRGTSVSVSWDQMVSGWFSFGLFAIIIVWTKWSVGGSVFAFFFDQMVSGWFGFGLFAIIVCFDQMVSGWFGFGLFGIVWTKWSVGG